MCEARCTWEEAEGGKGQVPSTSGNDKLPDAQLQVLLTCGWKCVLALAPLGMQRIPSRLKERFSYKKAQLLGVS